MASQRLLNFPPSPNKKRKAKRSKRRPEDNVDSSFTKRSKHFDPYADGNEAEDARRSKRSGAGSGGRISQLEKIGSALEKSKAPSRNVMGISEDLPDNPLAPPKKQKRGKAKVSVCQ
jgi:hypothetical protein